MTSCVIYLDESGDLGWTFSAPYRKGGSSRHLTISAVIVPTEQKPIPKRVIRGMYDAYKWPTGTEMKWNALTNDQRLRFATEAQKMAIKHADIAMHAIVVKKENVLPHIRSDGNKVYNYMIKLALLDEMAKYDVVTLVPDPKSIRVKSGNSLHDYLQTELWFTKKSITQLSTQPIDSEKCLGLQFADMLAGAVQMRYEDNHSAPMQIIGKHLKVSRLFF